jgi:sn-glycerol 3-phosphate transport system permease protein
MVRVVYDSLFIQNQAVQIAKFGGLANYTALFSDPSFRDVITNTLLYVVITVPVSAVLALVLALLLNRKFRALGLYRLSFFYPTVLPMVSAATIWLFMYTPGYGLINVFIGLFHIPDQNWLGTPNLALPALMILGVWKLTGYYMIFFLAGIQSLPHDIFESARLDGASTFQATRFITLPLLMGTTLFVTTIAVVNAFETVDQIYIMTKGGPVNASEVMATYMYRFGFVRFWFGYGCAVAIVMFLICLAFSLVYQRLQRQPDYLGGV